MSLLKVNEIQIFNGETVTITAPAVITANDNTNAALRITQTGTGNALVVEDADNPDSTPFVVDGDGRLLVGTSSVRTIGNIEASIFNEGTFGGSSSVGLVRNSNNNAGPFVLFGKSRGTSNGSSTIVQAQDVLGAIAFAGADGIDLNTPAAQIDCRVDGTPGTNDMPGRLIFSTTASGASLPTERMRINSAGNVGIGTTAPNSKLNVSTNSTDAAVTITQTGTGNALVVEDSANPDSTPFVVDASGRVGIGTTSPTTNLHLIGIQKIQTRTDIFNGNYTLSYQSATNTVDYGSVWRHHQGDDESSDAGIMLGGSGAYEGRMVFETAGTERMRIDSAGNVGIGTSSPSQKLDVTGNINATGALTLGTALAIAEGGTGATSASAARIALLPTLGTAGQVLAVNTGTTDVEWVDASAGGGSGTVTSVAISGTDGIEVDSGSPITTSGTIALGINAATLSSHLSLGTAATTAATDYATAAQGSLADSAVQPGDDAADLGSGAATDGYVLTADGAGGAAWEAASGGGGGTTAYLEHSSTISDSFTVASGTNRMYIGGTTFSGTITVAGRLAIVAGPANFTGTINITGTLATV